MVNFDKLPLVPLVPLVKAHKPSTAIRKKSVYSTRKGFMDFTSGTSGSVIGFCITDDRAR